MPSGLSPSSIDLWHQCPRRFEQEKVNGRSGGTGAAAVAGTNVHRALELLLQLPPKERTREAAYACLKEAWPECVSSGEFKSLGLSEEEVAAFRRSAVASIRTYLTIEDPARVDVVATERFMNAELSGVPFRGIIDRLDRDRSGGLIVTDYKNGKVPAPMFQGPKLRQLNFYGALVEAVDGKRPKEGRLVFTAYGKVIDTRITQRSMESAVGEAVEVWDALKWSFDNDDFLPKTGPLCGWCPFAAECPEGLAFLQERRAEGKLKKAAPNYDLAAPTPD